MVAVAATIFAVMAGSAAAQFPGMGMPMGGMMPQMGGMMPPQMGGMMPPQMGGMMPPQMGGGMPMPPMMGGGGAGGLPQFPQMPNMPNMFANFGAPAKKPAAAAPAPAPTAARPNVAKTAAPAQAQAQAPPRVPITDIIPPAMDLQDLQLEDMGKWAEMMGMPKMNEDDMKKIHDMQQGMLSKLKSLKEDDLSAMREDQNALADEMDRVMKNPTAEDVASFQSKQENLMSQWASKLNLPKITPQEHDMMRDQLSRMFNTLKAMPANEIEALRAKHDEIKKMALAHAANN